MVVIAEQVQMLRPYTYTFRPPSAGCKNGLESRSGLGKYTRNQSDNAIALLRVKKQETFQPIISESDDKGRSQ